MITNIGLEFKLINSTNFGKSVFSVGFIQKTVKEDLIIKGNNEIPPRKQHGKTLEDSRRLSTEDDYERLKYGAGRPHLQASRPMGSISQSLLRTSVSHRLLDYIYAVLSSRFDPRVQN
jgi:hypothetical protein